MIMSISTVLQDDSSCEYQKNNSDNKTFDTIRALVSQVYDVTRCHCNIPQGYDVKLCHLNAPSGV